NSPLERAGAPLCLQALANRPRSPRSDARPNLSVRSPLVISGVPNGARRLIAETTHGRSLPASAWRAQCRPDDSVQVIARLPSGQPHTTANPLARPNLMSINLLAHCCRQSARGVAPSSACSRQASRQSARRAAAAPPASPPPSLERSLDIRLAARLKAG